MKEKTTTFVYVIVVCYIVIGALRVNISFNSISVIVVTLTIWTDSAEQISEDTYQTFRICHFSSSLGHINR